MVDVSASVDFDRAVKEIEKRALRALAAAARAACEDVKGSGTMPLDTGRLQNSATYVDAGGLKDNTVAVVSDTDYAGRVYFHPEIKFNQSRNKKAGGRWFDAYLSGDKRDLPFKAFEEAMRNEE